MKRVILVAVLLVMTALIGCAQVSVDVPEGLISQRPRVDSSKVPPTTTHSECRQQLEIAYGEIRRLERKVDGLEKDKKELKDENKKLEKQLKKYHD